MNKSYVEAYRRSLLYKDLLLSGCSQTDTINKYLHDTRRRRILEKADGRSGVYYADKDTIFVTSENKLDTSVFVSTLIDKIDDVINDSVDTLSEEDEREIDISESEDEEEEKDESEENGET